MNKYNLKEFIEEELKEFKSTFKDTSLDDNGNSAKKYLCQDDRTEVFDFDEYIKSKYKKRPASPDAIYIGNKKFYFVEFKNSSYSSVDTKKIKDKFKSGTKILKELLKGFTPKDNKFIFCVVYKANAKPKYFNSSFIESNATKFGIEEENNKLDNFYDELITQDVDFYKENFTELSCNP